jgi:hypothetical protein
VEGETLVASVGSKASPTPQKFTEIADDRSVEADFRESGRVLSAELARRYADHVAVETLDDDGLFDAHVKVAALARIDEVRGELDRAADKLARQWIDEYRVAVKGLPDDRRAVYEDIVAMARDPQRIEILEPRVRAEETRDEDGEPLATATGHLMADEQGAFPIGALNTWERQVLETEMARGGFLAWYRNPSRASADSLAIAYKDGKGNWRRMCPDFVFFHGDEEDVRISVVDPHGFHLVDALAKLRGLADYAEQYGGELHRIESVAKTKDGAARVLDLTKEVVRKALREADDVESVYGSDIAHDYA